MTPTNPFEPSGQGLIWWISSAVLWLLIVIPTMISILRTREKLGTLDTTLWLVLTALFPLIGIILWLAVGRTRADRML